MRRALLLACRARGELAHPLELAAEGLLAGGLALLLLLQPSALLLEPGRVVALPRDAPAAVELEDPAGHVVEEVAVVGHGDDGARVLLQMPLQPGHRLRVEVVGGLVQQQQVGRRQQQAAEGHPPALTARQRRHVLVARGHAQRVHGDLERALQVPGVAALDLVLHVLVLGEQGLHLLGIDLAQPRSDLLEPPQQAGGLGDPQLDVPAHVQGRVEVGLLREHAHGGPGRQLRVARGLLVEPRHHAQERGLAGAVRAEDADLGAGQEGQRHVVQHHLVGRMHLPEAVHGEDVLLGHVSQRNEAPAAPTLTRPRYRR